MSIVFKRNLEIDNAYTRKNFDIVRRISVDPTLDTQFGVSHRILENDIMVSKFANQSYDMNRGSTATYVDATGKLRTAAIDEPRYTYKDGKIQGLLVEPQATNLLLWSEDFSQSIWTKTGATFSLEDGGFTSIVEDGSTAWHGFQYTDVSLNDLSITLSIIAKRGTRDWLYLRTGSNQWGAVFFNLATGTIGTVTGSVMPQNYGIEHLGDGVYRCWIARENSQSPVIRMFSATNDNQIGGYTGVLGTKAIFVKNAQVEVGTRPSSYIPTQASQVTRLPDIVTRTVADEFNPNEGTVAIEGEYIAGQTVFQSNGWGIMADVTGYKKYARSWKLPMPELIVNGDFSDGSTGWTTYSGAIQSAINNRLVITNTITNFGGSYQNFFTAIGKTYVIKAKARRIKGSSSWLAVGRGGAGEQYYLGVAWPSDTSFEIAVKATHTVMSVKGQVHNGAADNSMELWDVSVREATPEELLELKSGTHNRLRYYPKQLTEAEIEVLTK